MTWTWIQGLLTSEPDSDELSALEGGSDHRNGLSGVTTVVLRGVLQQGPTFGEELNQVIREVYECARLDKIPTSFQKRDLPS